MEVIKLKLQGANIPQQVSTWLSMASKNRNFGADPSARWAVTCLDTAETERLRTHTHTKEMYSIATVTTYSTYTYIFTYIQYLKPIAFHV